MWKLTCQQSKSEQCEELLHFSAWCSFSLQCLHICLNQTHKKWLCHKYLTVNLFSKKLVFCSNANLKNIYTSIILYFDRLIHWTAAMCVLQNCKHFFDVRTNHWKLVVDSPLCAYSFQCFLSTFHAVQVLLLPESRNITIYFWG